MQAASMLLAAWFFASPPWAGTDQSRQAPDYSAASILNSASNVSGAFAPNTIISLYGNDLSWATKAVAPEDIRGGVLPTLLPGTGVRVLVNHIPANIYFVSPHQVNLLLPSNLEPGRVDLQLVSDGRAGPNIPILLGEAAPALFLQAPGIAVATRADGSLITPESPALPGEVVILYATGLGVTSPATPYSEIPRGAASRRDMAQFQVFLDGEAVEAGAILYAGVSPGFAGLYQVNLRLPATPAQDPEIRLAAGQAASPAGVRLPAKP